jgi:hypothetical protein
VFCHENDPQMVDEFHMLNGLIYQSFQPGSMVFTMFLPQDFWGGSTVPFINRFGDMMCCLTGASQQLVNSSYLDG